MPPRQKSPDSDESDGIYEKIIDGPPSPGSSTESTTGVEAPLISHKLKFSTLKVDIFILLFIHYYMLCLSCDQQFISVMVICRSSVRNKKIWSYV